MPQLDVVSRSEAEHNTAVQVRAKERRQFIRGLAGASVGVFIGVTGQVIVEAPARGRR